MTAEEPVVRTRREVILESAARLFSERGYPSTGIDEIGAAAGITGPGVYRHFESKNGVLDEVVRRAVERLVAGVADAVGDGATDGPSGWAVLERLVRNMIAAVLEDRTAWAVVVREQRHLDPPAARSLAAAHQLHLDEWTHALAAARPELSPEEVRVIVHGVLGVAAPFAARYDAGVSPERTVELLQEAAMAILRQALPQPRRPAR